MFVMLFVFHNTFTRIGHSAVTLIARCTGSRWTKKRFADEV